VIGDWGMLRVARFFTSAPIRKTVFVNLRSEAPKNLDFA
jgi:hypothetical protein